MRKKMLFWAPALFLLFAALPAAAGQSGLTQIVAEGCKVEIESYCKKVTPGEGRILACLYAYSDKLSGQCEYALYDAAARLERAITALTYLANECSRDLETYCSHVAAGKGRLIKCLEDNGEKISPRCKQALAVVGAQAK